MLRHGVYIPTIYGTATKQALAESLETSLRPRVHTSSPQDHVSVTKSSLMSAAENTETLIVAFNAHDGASLTGTGIMDDLGLLKARDPERKNVLYLKAQGPADIEGIKASPLFNAAADSEHVDLIYTDMPQPGHARYLDTGFHPRAFKSVLQTLVQGKFETRMVSPELVTPVTDQTLQIGDFSVDRVTRVVSVGGREAPGFTETEARILGALAAYQQSWVPLCLMLAEVYPGANAVPEAKIIDVYMTKLKPKFAAAGAGKVQNMWGVGRYVRPSEFTLRNAMR